MTKMCIYCHNTQCDSGRLCGSKDREPIVIQGISPESEAKDLGVCDRCGGEGPDFVWRSKELVCFKCLGLGVKK